MRAWGPRPAYAFAQAARGLYAVILGHDPPGGDVEQHVDVAGEDWDELLVNWLAELLYLFELDGFIAAVIELETCAPPRCAASLRGSRLDDPESAAGVAVKAVTYHQLAVDVRPDRTEIRVILDI